MKVVNRRARSDYSLLDSFEVGIELTGPEVKSVKDSRIDLSQAYIKIKNGQAQLINAHIAPYQAGRTDAFASNRTRRLLLHKRELLALEMKTARSRLTIVPESCYTKHGWVKLRIALARPKKHWEKRDDIKKRDLEREVERELSKGM